MPVCDALVCSNEALAHVLRQIGFRTIGNLLGYRRDPRPAVGHPDADVRPDPHLLRDGARRPAAGGVSRVHPKWKTPYIVTAITGIVVAIAAAFLPVGQLADIANAGTLYAFAMVAIAVICCAAPIPTHPRRSGCRHCG